jgi:hypothetical protein
VIVASTDEYHAAYEKTDVRDGFAPTFFPSTLDFSAAQRVRVARGQETSGLAIALITSRTVRISGHIVTSEGRAAADASLMVQKNSQPSHFSWGGMVQADGSFELQHVTAGTMTWRTWSPGPRTTPSSTNGFDSTAPCSPSPRASRRCCA